MTDIERYSSTTPFVSIYEAFFSQVTDDMYVEWTEEETRADSKNILMSAISNFERPKFNIYDYDLDSIEEDGSRGHFNLKLGHDETMIIADLMLIEWIKRQIATIDITRMKYSSSDFKLTSQASHLNSLLALKKDFQNDINHKQKVYRRRTINSDGTITNAFNGMGGGVL